MQFFILPFPFLIYRTSKSKCKGVHSNSANTVQGRGVKHRFRELGVVRGQLSWLCGPRENLIRTNTLFIHFLFFLPHSITPFLPLATIWGPPSPQSLLLEDRGVEIGTKWRDGMRGTEGTILIKMFAQKIISRVALLIMTNACKGSTCETHGVWGCSPWKRARTLFYPPQMEVGRLSSSFCSSLKQLVWPPGDVTLLLIGSLPLLQRTDSPTLMWNPRWAAAQHKHTLIYTHCPYVRLPVYTRTHQCIIKGEMNIGELEEVNAD